MAAKDDYAKNEQILKKSIKNNEIGRLYLFYGLEDYLKRNYTDYIEKSMLEKQYSLFNRVDLEGKITPSVIIDNCETLPLFSDKKMVVVKNSGLFKGAKRAGAAAANTADAALGSGNPPAKKKSDNELANFLQNVPEHACLIFIETDIDKRIKYVNLINDNGLIVEFDYRKPDELVKWVMTRIRELGHEVDPRTAAMIVDYCETGMDDILNELKKLCSYAGDRPEITEQDVAAVCTRSIKSRIFDLTDAIGARQTAKALSLLNDMEAMREPMPLVMYMITRHFRQLVQTKMMLGDKMTQAQIAAQLKTIPYVASKLIRQVGSFPAEKLEKAVSTGLELDINTKTGVLDSKVAAELMIMELSS